MATCKETMMYGERQVGLVAAVLLAMVLSPTSVRAQVDQLALAAKLRRGTVVERSRAVEAARVLGGHRMGPELRTALIEALERENRVHVRRYQAGRRGETLGPLDDPEFILRVSRVVADLQDPRAIPALAGALGTGSTVTEALVAFGEQAVPAVLAVVTSRNSMHYTVDEGLVMLRFLVEGAGPLPLSAETLERVRRAAEQRLTGKQYFTTLWDAIDLATALKDPGLRRVVESLASDSSAILARGIEDPELIQETQRLAADRLAGVAPEPR
jgi:hypothetical protein